MSEMGGDRAGIDTVVYKLVTAAVAEHVRVNILEPMLAASSARPLP
jgi:hypothetical protein